MTTLTLERLQRTIERLGTIRNEKEGVEVIMAEQQFVVFTLGKEEYALPIASVKEIVIYHGATKLPGTPAFMEGIINLRGIVIPVIDLANRFGVAASNAPEKKVVIIETTAGQTAVIVDEVTEVVRIGDELIEPPPAISRLNGLQVEGVGKLKNRLLILLNTEHLLDEQEAAELRKAV